VKTTCFPVSAFTVTTSYTAHVLDAKIQLQMYQDWHSSHALRMTSGVYQLCNYLYRIITDGVSANQTSRKRSKGVMHISHRGVCLLWCLSLPKAYMNLATWRNQPTFNLPFQTLHMTIFFFPHAIYGSKLVLLNWTTRRNRGTREKPVCSSFMCR
jgi:hypothetical protein